MAAVMTGQAARLCHAAGAVGRALVALVLSLAAGCDGALLGLSEERTPLATLRVRLAASADLQGLAAPRVVVLWGAQEMGETFCFAAALAVDASLTAVADAGCRDPLGFVPLLAGPSAAVNPDGTASLDLYDLPPADVMVGDLTARVAFGSLVLYDDDDRDGRFRIGRPRWRGGGPGEGPPDRGDAPADAQASGGEVPDTSQSSESQGERNVDGFGDFGGFEAIHAASFVSMQAPDVRLAFREGAFDAASAFYPRAGCPPPPPGYALLRADGFSLLNAIAALAQGALPATSGCGAEALDVGVVELARAPTETLRGVGCAVGNSVGALGTSRYRAPPDDAKWLATQKWTCQPLAGAGAVLGGLLGSAGPGPGGAGAGKSRGGGRDGERSVPPRWQLSVAYPATTCPAVRHYVLRGCSDDAACESPQWDLQATPPLWWPCPSELP